MRTYFEDGNGWMVPFDKVSMAIPTKIEEEKKVCKIRLDGRKWFLDERFPLQQLEEFKKWLNRDNEDELFYKLSELLTENTSESGSFHISYNEHKDYGRTVIDHIRINEYDDEDFTSEEEFQMCISSNKMYSLKWYKDSPVGQILICGYSLELIQKAVEDIINDRG